MLKYVLLVIGFGLVVCALAPSAEPERGAAAPAPPGLFDAAPYKETELERESNGHFFVTAEVNGVPIHFMVDTGATMVALTQDDARTAGIDFSADEFEPIAQTANGIARGKMLTLGKVAIEGKEVTEVDAAIMENGNISLLGQAYLSRISGVQMNGDTMVLR